jgi:hypothetical protein
MFDFVLYLLIMCWGFGFLEPFSLCNSKKLLITTIYELLVASIQKAFDELSPPEAQLCFFDTANVCERNYKSSRR